MKRCNTCSEFKDVESFRGPNVKMCKKCKSKIDYERRDKAKTKENSERYRRKKGMKQKEQNIFTAGLKKGDKRYGKHYNLMSKYGITINDYDNMRIEQNYRCKICDIHEDDLTKGLVTDHCHTTKRVRGLLCTKCNVALGLFKDNKDSLINAIEYLTE